jgi:hypothetical protein
MMSFRPTLRASVLAFLVAGTAAHAGVVEYADVGGFRTFQDTLTGKVWADLDARFAPAPSNVGSVPVPSYPTYGAYKTALEAAGFVWATSIEVMAMLDTLTFSSNATTARAEAVAYATVMSTLTFEPLEPGLGGIAENTSTPTGQRRHSLVFSSMPQWGTFASSADFSAATNSGVGLWAYLAAPNNVPAPVSAPGSLALAGLALAALAAQRAKQKA